MFSWLGERKASEQISSFYFHENLFRQSSPSHLTVENISSTQDIEFSYKITNNGLSDIKQLTVTIQIPVIYAPDAKSRYPIIDINFIDAQALYRDQTFNATWMNNEISFNQDRTKLKRSNKKSMNFDYSKNGFDFDIMTSHSVENFQQNHIQRKRRSTLQNNPLEKDDQILMNNLPKNRTIFANCSNKFECIEAQFIITEFKHSPEPIIIKLNFSLDLFGEPKFNVYY